MCSQPSLLDESSISLYMILYTKKEEKITKLNPIMYAFKIINYEESGMMAASPFLVQMPPQEFTFLKKGMKIAQLELNITHFL